MSPLGAPFSKFSLKSLRGLVETLRQVHNLGYVHRDIRQSNLVVYGEDVYLIDWGFAAPIGQSDFSGQVYYLAEELLLTEKFPLVTYTPKHDLEMLVKMLFSHLFEEKITSLKTQTNELEGVKKRKKIAEWWSSTLLQVNPIWKVLFKLCESVDYDGLLKMLDAQVAFW